MKKLITDANRTDKHGLELHLAVILAFARMTMVMRRDCSHYPHKLSVYKYLILNTFLK
jgi:hypothetical protein